jgi:hypothetical protein
MVEYTPIGDLVRRIPDAAWDTLAEIHKKRPAMMLGELLAVAERKRTPKVERPPPEPQSPSNPARRHG